MFSQVDKFIDQCEECQRRARVRHPGLLQPQYTETIFSRVNIDTVKVGNSSPHRSTRGARGIVYHSIIIARDDLSGWVEARAISDGGAATVAKFFMEEVVYRHGVPPKVVMDGGSEFKGEFQAQLESLGVKGVVISAYHPESAGMIERGHKPILDALSKRCSGKPDEWPLHLPAVLWADRITTKRTTKQTPFFMVYGRHSLLPIHFVETTWATIDWNSVKTTSDLLFSRMLQIEDLEQVRIAGQHRADKAREISVDDRNKHQNLCPDIQTLSNGDLVLLHNTEKERQYGDKLRFHWRGPFRINKSSTQKSWRLFELDGTQLAGTFALDRLKKYNGGAPGATTQSEVSGSEHSNSIDE